MLHAQMRRRCPKSMFVKAVKLKDHKFVYDGCSENRKGAVGNIVKASGHTVWGGLYEITAECLKQLDECEDYPNSYDRTTVQIQDSCGKTCDALVYFRTGRELGTPSESYRQIVIEGARNCGIDEAYIAKYLDTPAKAD
jgi:gamma-glutamylcyclotransferase (GGCT)/AIG2-like uncharacterized protein YtfP